MADPQPTFLDAARPPTWDDRLRAHAGRCATVRRLRDALRTLAIDLAALDAHPDWSAQQVAAAAGIAAEQVAICRLIQLEKGSELRARMHDGG
jgi:hypothetical protein